MKNSWLFPIVEAVHLMGVALAVGTLVVCWLLGLPTTPFRPWTRIGIWILSVTGLALLLSDLTRYVHNPAFLTKAALLVGAIFVHRRAPVWARVTWLAAIILAARAIADFDV